MPYKEVETPNPGEKTRQDLLDLANARAKKRNESIETTLTSVAFNHLSKPASRGDVNGTAQAQTLRTINSLLSQMGRTQDQFLKEVENQAKRDNKWNDKFAETLKAGAMIAGFGTAAQSSTFSCLKSKFESEEAFQSTMYVSFKTVPGGLAVTVAINRDSDCKLAVVAVNGQALGTIDLSLLGNPKYTVFAVEQDQDAEGEFMNVYIIPVPTFDGRLQDGTRCLMFTYDVANQRLYGAQVWTLNSDK